MGQQTRGIPGQKPFIKRKCMVIAGMLLMARAPAAFAEWEGHESMTRESLISTLSTAIGAPRIDLRAKNLSGLDLHGIDFKGANLSSSVFNGANLRDAKMDNTNLTVAFFEGADLTGASFRNAVLFSAQLAGAKARGVDFDGVRFIGDLRRTDFTDAKMTHMKGAADMKNQSMGLMHTSMVNGIAVGADLSDSSFERAEFTFSDFSRAKMVNAKLYRADFSGSKLVGVDLTGADLREALLINADLTNANLTNADFTGANLQGAAGLDSAIKIGARGLPNAVGNP